MRGTPLPRLGGRAAKSGFPRVGEWVRRVTSTRGYQVGASRRQLHPAQERSELGIVRQRIEVKILLDVTEVAELRLEFSERRVSIGCASERTKDNGLHLQAPFRVPN
jgi:hypothetical protein